MTEITETRRTLENMEIGDKLTFPKDFNNRIRSMARSMYCHGKTLLIKKNKGEDFITVLRVE